MRIALESVVGGLAAPLAAAGSGDGSGRLFVVEQAGVIRIVRDGRLLDRPFLDIRKRVASGGERGLLGLAFPPGFGTDRDTFYVHYSDLEGDTVIASFRVRPDDPNRANPRSERVVFTANQPYANHNGGWIGFGPDDMLYVALGDGGAGGDPQDRAERLDTPLGKLLRLDVLSREGSPGKGYAIPAGNPFVATAKARPEVWAYGLRNPWRASFDRATGDLWIGDVGQGSWEEINRSLAADGAGRGVDFGWDTTEGRHCFEPKRGCDKTDIHLPLAEYDHDQGCTVVGGYVYRGSASPVMAGTYLFGDYCSGRIWGLASGGPGAQRPIPLANTKLTISSFGEDDDGELYATDLAGGRLYRIEGSPRG